MDDTAGKENSARKISLVSFISHRFQYFGSVTYVRKLKIWSKLLSSELNKRFDDCDLYKDSMDDV